MVRFENNHRNSDTMDHKGVPREAMYLVLAEVVSRYLVSQNDGNSETLS